MLQRVSFFIALCLLALPALATGGGGGGGGGGGQTNACAVNNGGCGDPVSTACSGGINGAPVSCYCKFGYDQTSSGCVAHNQCASNNGGCDVNADCACTLATYGPVTCTCKPGFRGPNHNGWYCPTEVDKCQTANGGCGENANCYNGVGNGQVQCQCKDKYYMSNGACVAINACQTNNGGCNENAVCSCGLASYDVTCTCKPEFRGPNHNGYYCPPTDQPSGGGENPPTGGGGEQSPNWDCPSPANNEWEWRYDVPTCEALRVEYPSSLAPGHSNDVNIRITYPGGETTLNFHLNNGFWSGVEYFHLQQHPNWPRNVATYSVVWVQVAGTNCHWSGSVDCCQYPGEAGGVIISNAPCSSEPPMAPTENPPTNPHEWTYPPPVCTGVTVEYPIWLPAGQSNDVNIRVYFPTLDKEITFNFHNDFGTWSGSTQFVLQSKPNWPAGVTTWVVEWVQVGGTNYHWNGNVNCP